MKTPITTAVPHPGATFQYSELRGFRAVPSGVTFPCGDFALSSVLVAIQILL